ncbi:MAG: YihY/virulence factor BrkB family protein [Chitinivibrionales bacterium]
MKHALAFIKEVFGQWAQDKAMIWAAAVAYYAIFSIAPLILIIISISALVLGKAAARGQILGQLENAIGPTAAEAVQSMLANAGARPISGILGTIIGFLILFWAASNIFKFLQMAIDTMWNIEQQPGGGVKAFLLARLAAASMVIIMGVILLSSFLLSTLLSMFWQQLQQIIQFPSVLLSIGDFLVSLIVIWVLFAFIFKFLPHARVGWKHVWIGAGITAILFTIGKFIIGLYIGQSDVASSYGIVGSLVVLLIWINYSVQIFLLGAEFIQALVRQQGQVVKPARGGMKTGGLQPSG